MVSKLAFAYLILGKKRRLPQSSLAVNAKSK